MLYSALQLDGSCELLSLLVLPLRSVTIQVKLVYQLRITMCLH